MTAAAITTLVILFLTVIFFVSNKLRSDVVALLSLLSLLLFGILTPEEALAGFSSNIVMMMIGLFVVGGAIFETGLAQIISNKLLSLSGNSPFKLFMVVVLSTAAIGGFVSNTGTVALMMPIVVSLAMSAKISSSRLLMPIAFASSIGGMLTLIGTPPNLIIHDTLIKAGYKGLSFFSFLPVGLVSIALGTLLLYPLSKWFLSKKEIVYHDKDKGRTPQSLVNEYHLAHNLYRVRVKADSPFAGKQICEINIRSVYNINILEIRRRADKYIFSHVEQQIKPMPQEVIKKNDVLYAMGDFDDVRRMVGSNALEWVDTVESDKKAPVFSEKLQFAEIGIAEVVIMSNSRLIGEYLVDSGFRENYNLNVLGIQRNNKYMLKGLKNEKIHSGDALLVQGDWADISRLRKEDDSVVVVGQDISEETGPKLLHKAPLAGLIMMAMIACMSFNWLQPVVAVMIAALLMTLTGCLRNVESAYEKINWQSIVLIGAMLPMAVALEKTGIAHTISNVLVGGLGNYGSNTLVLAGVYAITSVMTLFISNTATAALIAPIAISTAMGLGVSPYPFLFAVTVAATMCFASPFSTPPNALVMSAGRYSFMDYVKVGLPMQIIFGIVMIFVLPVFFPF